MRAAAGGSGDSSSAEPQAAVTGRCMLIGREVLVYLAEPGQLDVDVFNLTGDLESAGQRQRMPDNEHGHATSGNAVSGVYRLVVYHGIEATSCQAERNFQRSPTSLVTCAVGCLQVRSSA